MKFIGEDSFKHENPKKIGVILCNLGTPDSYRASDVGRFLKEFLSDGRVVEIPKIVWWFILNLIIVPIRSQKSAKLYKSIWTEDGSPLLTYSNKIVEKIKKTAPKNFEIELAMRYGKPKMEETLLSLKNKNCQSLLVLPMFPQYSESTIASGVDALAKELSQRVKIPTFEVITNFHRTHAFIDNSVTQLDAKVEELKEKGIEIDKLVISFHGMQKRRVVFKGDDYYRHCYETFRLIVDRLKHLKPEQAIMTFQSRFGSEEWITPYTEATVEKLIEEGNKELMVYSPSFVADCLETTDELGHELAEDAKEWGGNVYPVECLNVNDQWCKDFAKYVMTQAEGSAQDKEDIEYQLRPDDYEAMPELEMKSAEA